MKRRGEWDSRGGEVNDAGGGFNVGAVGLCHHPPVSHIPLACFSPFPPYTIMGKCAAAATHPASTANAVVIVTTAAAPPHSNSPGLQPGKQHLVLSILPLLLQCTESSLGCQARPALGQSGPRCKSGQIHLQGTGRQAGR